MMERNSSMRQAKTYAEVLTQPQRAKQQQNNMSEDRNRVSPTTEGKEVMELEIETENLDWLTGCYVGQTYEIEQVKGEGGVVKGFWTRKEELEGKEVEKDAARVREAKGIGGGS
ncbi:hypothetical protein Ancab_011198 [Ancistrocladus abbreviatus]